MKTEITACMRCGSRNLDFTPGDGMAVFTKLGVGPIGGIAVCKDCGRVGGPIVFGKEKDYRAFLLHLKRLKAEEKS